MYEINTYTSTYKHFTSKISRNATSKLPTFYIYIVHYKLFNGDWLNYEE